MVPVSQLFEVRYGVNLELNALVRDPRGLPFVSRTAKNNGVSARVALLPHLEPIAAGTISVAGARGSVMESFLQPQAYYSGRDLYYLTEKVAMNNAQKLFYCACLRANKYRFNYGRQANRTLRDILIPKLDEIPSWANNATITQLNYASQPANTTSIELSPTDQWKPFSLAELFELKKGKRLTKAQMSAGVTRFIGAIDSNNGVSHHVAQSPLHPANTMTVNYNGNGVAEAFYQDQPYRASDDVNILYPRFPLTPAIGLFIATLIRQEKYRFSYGRKWHLERMENSEIRLPVKSDGEPDWTLIERFVATLPFSSQLE